MKLLLKLLIPTAVFLFVVGTMSAQGNCGTKDALDRILKKNPELLQLRKAKEQSLQKNENPSQERSLPIITIPVVVHVVWYSGVPAQNISDAQINSQITALNRDFRKQNFDVLYVPSYFKELAADVQLQFCLAQRSPSCEPTNGITRTESATATWGLDDAVKFSSSGGADIWDRDKYLNIWVCDLYDRTGYAQYPNMGSAETDGVVVDYQCFGTMGTAVYPLNGGRVAVHEVGHWFNLIHIFGEDDFNGGGCSGDDLVTDTPNQADANRGCPDDIPISCNNGPNGDMYMNYMDYVDDDCMHMFTEDQKTRMRYALDNFRSSLIHSLSCIPPGVCENLPPVTVTNISGPTMLCAGEGQSAGQFTSGITPYESACMTGVWSTWSGLSILHQVVLDDGVSHAIVQGLQPGLHTLYFRAFITSCGETEVITKTFQVRVCAQPNAPVPIPPGMDLICTSEEPECYTFNNNCNQTFLVSTNDPHLIATVNGSTICLSSNFYKRRTSRLNVTPINFCGQGPTSYWFVNIDDLEDCFFLSPPNDPGTGDQSSKQEAESAEYAISCARNQIRVEDLGEASDLTEKSIQLLTIDGRSLIDYQTSDAFIQMDLSQEYPAGIYLLRIMKGNQVFTKKIMVQN